MATFDMRMFSSVLQIYAQTQILVLESILKILVCIYMVEQNTQ